MIALIPFRKGSKRIKDKNIKLFYNRPLYLHSYYAARSLEKHGVFSKVVLATDYPKELIEDHIFIDTPLVFKREAVSEEEPAAKYINDVIKRLKLPDEDDICLLQPTCPLRSIVDIDSAVDKYLRFKNISKTLVSVTEVEPIVKLYEPYSDRIVSLANNDNLVCETHTKNNIYKRNSSIYIFNVGFFKKTGVIFEREPNYYVMPWYRSVDIDTHEDFEFAEKIAKG